MTSECFKKWGFVLLPVVLFLLTQRLLTTVLFPEVVTSCIVMPFIVLWYWRKERENSVSRPAADRPGFHLFLSLLFLILGISLTSSFILARIRGTISAPQPPSVVRILGIAIAGPINEELIYRGVLFKRSQDILGTTGALLLSSLLFGVSHAGLLEIILSMAVGLIFGLVRLRYHCLRHAILVHIGVNLLSFCNVIEHLPLPIYILGFLLLAISIGMMIPANFKTP